MLDFLPCFATIRLRALRTAIIAEGGMPQIVKDDILTAAQACRYLNIAQRTLYRYAEGHHIPAFKLGKEWRFVRSDLRQWRRRATTR